MNVLGIDCSAQALCVAVRRSSSEQAQEGLPSNPRKIPPKHPFRESRGHEAGNGVVILEIDAGLRHAQRLLPAVELCLRDVGLSLSDLDLLACAAGPGSFTGLRIAMSTIKGLASALDLPFVAVPTLDCLAGEWEGAPGILLPVLDAHRGQFYAAFYDRGVRISGYLDLPLADLLALADSYPAVLVVGPDADLFLEAEQDHPGIHVARYGRGSSGRALLDLAESRFLSQGPEPDDASPLYIRQSDAQENAEKIEGG